MGTWTKAARRAIRRAFYRRGYRFERVSRIHFLEPLLCRRLQRSGSLFFIQIGANDGRSFDPLYEFVTSHSPRVRGIVVEPLRDFFEQLKTNYRKCPQVVAVNAAIHNSEKEMTLYRVDPARLADLPGWAKGIASFDKKHYERSGMPRDAMVPETVPCMTIGELVEAHHVAEVDLLQIDTEGYDAEILSSLDFEKVRPAIIRFEHGLGDGIMSEETFGRIVELLHGHGYELAVEEHDATAYRRGIMTE